VARAAWGARWQASERCCAAEKGDAQTGRQVVLAQQKRGGVQGVEA